MNLGVVMNIKNMKYSLTIALALAGFGCMPMQGMESSSSLASQEQELIQKFMQTYAPLSLTCRAIERCNDRLQKPYVEYIPELFWLYFKGHDITRIINAERLRACIKEHNLTCLNVVKKYVYPVGDKLAVFAEKVIPNRTLLPVTLEEIKQCQTCMTVSGYTDWGFPPISGSGLNIMRDHTGKLIFIDTEGRSFGPRESALNSQYNQNSMTEEAWDWLQEQEQPKKLGYLPEDSSFDGDIGIDFAKIKVLLKDHVGFKLPRF